MIMVLGGAALAWAACDFQKIGNQATARAVAVSTLLTTPPVELKPEAIAGGGFDAGLGDLDAGALLDAGLLPTDAGVTVPPQNLAFVFFGQRQGEGLDTAPMGVPGATVTLVEVGGGRFALADQGGGNYALTEADAGFVYRDGATYNFEIVSGGTTYVAEVVRVPPRENIAQFRPPGGFVELNAGEPFTFTRPDPPMGEDRHLGFINVFPINREGQQGQPTYTNIPTTPLDFLKLVVAPNDWKKTTVTIPGTAFPARDANYLVVLQSAKLGGPKSDNLFTGSAILAGTADVAIIKTRP
jgi:hypothetical protein